MKEAKEMWSKFKKNSGGVYGGGGCQITILRFDYINQKLREVEPDLVIILL